MSNSIIQVKELPQTPTKQDYIVAICFLLKLPFDFYISMYGNYPLVFQGKNFESTWFLCFLILTCS